MKIKHPWLLLLVAAFPAIIYNDLRTGVAHGRWSTVYRSTNPDAFWASIYAAGFIGLVVFFGFLLAQVGDGWNEDGEE